MALLDSVNKALVEAMKTKDALRLSTFRMLKAALVNKSVERGRDLDEAESHQVVATLVKQRRESIEQFLAGGRQDLVEKERAEIRVLETCLPPPLDQAQIDAAIDAAIAETGASSAKDLGRVMKVVMAKLAGSGTDGRAVNERVRQQLEGSQGRNTPPDR